MSVRQGAARMQRAIREGRSRAVVVAELVASGMTAAEVAEAVAMGDQAERRSVNNLMIAAVVCGLIGVALAVIGIFIGFPDGASLFGYGVGTIVGLALPPFIYGIVRLSRMS
jgi:hypothetical protein